MPFPRHLLTSLLSPAAFPYPFFPTVFQSRYLNLVLKLRSAVAASFLTFFFFQLRVFPLSHSFSPALHLPYLVYAPLF